ncbi:MAG: hypothetical protein JNK47_10905 [Mesorhizobium sp.]|nr:hypothetical protein [Mesorhizobium sp.]MBL8577727.1 hypothetical protein [Mesorhizobium sp.]
MIAFHRKNGQHLPGVTETYIGPAARMEAATHTDSPVDCVNAGYAYEAALAATNGNAIAAAILAHGIVLAEAVKERRRDD